MLPVDCNSTDQVLLKLCDFDAAMRIWINEVVIPRFFGELINLQTGDRMREYMQTRLPDFLSNFPIVRHIDVINPEVCGEYFKINLKIHLSDNSQMERFISIGQYIGYGENI